LKIRWSTRTFPLSIHEIVPGLCFTLVKPIDFESMQLLLVSLPFATTVDVLTYLGYFGSRFFYGIGKLVSPAHKPECQPDSGDLYMVVAGFT